MTIYIVFLIFILAIAFFYYYVKPKNKKNELRFLNIVWIAMFLLCALRASSVGRDLPGYENVYNYSFNCAWGDFEYVYFENGYILLMKVCSKALNMSFRQFLAFVTAVIMFPIYIYIRKYSSNYFLSTIVYVGYIFFEFNMTGLRQAIAASIVLVAYMVYISAKQYNVFYYTAIVILAAQFHKAAWICLVFLIFIIIRNLKVYIAAASCFSVALIFARGAIMSIIKDFFEKETMNSDASVYFGLNAIFTLALIVLFLLSYYNLIHSNKFGSLSESDKLLVKRKNEINLKLFTLAIPITILFGADTAARSYMMFSQTIIIQLPNAIDSWNMKDKAIMKKVFVVFFIIFFFTNTLLPNNFDIVPYYFFWQK